MLRYSIRMGWVFGLFVAISAGVFASAATADDEAESILNARCGACHADEGTGLSRINGQRKTPEGWLMTIVRMGIMHGVEVPPDEKRTLIKYLADTQGLAPSESAPYRYILERQPSHVEDFPPEYFFMCARCHSGARGALQGTAGAPAERKDNDHEHSTGNCIPSGIPQTRCHRARYASRGARQGDFVAGRR